MSVTKTGTKKEINLKAPGGLACTVKVGDVIQLGEEIFLQVVEKNGSNQFLMTFNCPKDMRIYFPTRYERTQLGKETLSDKV